MTTIYNSDQNQGVIQTISCFGDSLTAGAGGTAYPTQLSYLFPNRIIQNFGIGGQTMQQIAARQGGLPLYVTLSGNAFSGTTAISATVSTQLLSTAADTVTRYMSGVVLGIPCILTRSVVSTVETYTLQPVQGQSTAIPANSQFIPDDAFNARNHVQVLWLGRNNVPNLTGLDTLLDSCVAQLGRPRRFVVIGVLNGQTETVGTSSYNAITAMNAVLAANYPNQFIPSTSPTLAELAAINYSPTSQDLTDITAGIFPTGLRTDAVHLNTFGYLIIANRVAAKLQQLGWQ